MAITAINMVGPYLAVLSMIKLVLLILVGSEIAKALGKGGDGGGDDDSGPIRRRRDDDDEELNEVTIEIRQPGANDAKYERGKRYRFVAVVTKGKLPIRGRFFWFLGTEANFVELDGGAGNYWSRHTLFESKKVLIPEDTPLGNQFIKIRVTDSSRKRQVGENVRRIIIVDGAGQDSEPEPTNKIKLPTWSVKEANSTSTFIFDLLHNKSIFEKFSSEYAKLMEVIERLRPHRSNPDALRLFADLDKLLKEYHLGWTELNNNMVRLKNRSIDIAEKAGIYNLPSGKDIEAYHVQNSNRPEVKFAYKYFDRIRLLYNANVNKMHKVNKVLRKIIKKLDLEK